MIQRLQKITTILILLTATFILGGCRLYEPQRYTRLRFADDAPRTRVLFVGNSLTFYNDLPGLVQQLSVNEERPIEVMSITAPYVSLEWHWYKGRVQPLLRGNAGGGKWDYLVLQDFSRRPVTDPLMCEKYFERFAARARRTETTPLIFQNWTRSGRAKEYDVMLGTYKNVQQKTNAPLIPIGQAWQLCAQKHPDIKLYADDRHPTDEGTYLAACVIYGTIYGKSPTDLSTILAAPKISTEKIKILREVAAAVLAQNAAAPK